MRGLILIIVLLVVGGCESFGEVKFRDAGVTIGLELVPEDR